MPLPLAHDAALRWTRFAWIGVVAAAVIAVGAPLLPRASVTAPNLTLRDAAPAPGDAGGAEPAEFEDVRWVELEAALTAVHAVERPDQAVVAASTDERPGDAGSEMAQADEQPVEQQGLPGWRYVGDVAFGDRVVAVLSVSGAQVFLGHGEEVQGFTIAEIEPDFVVAEGRNGRFRIEREQAPGPMLRGAPAGSMQMRPQPEDAARLRDERLRNAGRDR